MKTIKINSKLIIAVILAAGLTLSSSDAQAQKDDGTNISLSLNGNKIDLTSNDDVFDLNLEVPKMNTDKIVDSITKEIGKGKTTMNGYKVWREDNYQFKVKDGSLYVFLDKKQMTKSEYDQLENIVESIFNDVDIDIDWN
ncbi:MAG: hypothetical protein KJP00_03140 [Bacteroidia bacterium]|nr:hypothetical protein [Bacteroidia bacterium]